jgi:hypothetical protein
MSIVNWKDLPSTAAEFIERFGETPTILAGQEQEAVEALRAKMNQDSDWEPLFLQAQNSIDDISSVSDSDSSSDSDGSYSDVMAFNKLVAQKPSESLFQDLNSCFTDNIVCSSDANLKGYIKMGSFVFTETLEVQSGFVDNLCTIFNCIIEHNQEDLDARTVAKAAIYVRKISNNRIRNLEIQNRYLKHKLEEADDEPIFKKKIIIDDDE